MPYANNGELPASIRHSLPDHAQNIYRAAFNHAFAAHAGDSQREEASYRIAWAAVKRSYVQVNGYWIEKSVLREELPSL